MDGTVRRLGVFDWLAAGLLAVGLSCLAAGLLPPATAESAMARVLPLLIFLGTMIVLVELTAQAEFFDVLATRLAIVARGSYPALFGLSVGFAALTTTLLNLDTTAVLLTPVMLAVAANAGIAATASAMTAVWLANTASLLLPVSNLTNLLAAGRVHLPVLAFAGRMALPQAGAVAATACCLWAFYWRRGVRENDRYLPPPPHRPRDPALFRVAAVTCAGYVAGIFAGLPLELVSTCCAVVVLLAFAVRAGERLRWALVPWRLLVFVSGLFLVVETISGLGLSTVLGTAVGGGPGPMGVLRAVGTGAGLANLINNLPAYLVGETAVPVANHDQLLGLLIGTDIGPIVVPWASLATLLWLERCRAAGLRVSWPRFVLTGAVTALAALAAATGGLLLR